MLARIAGGDAEGVLWFVSPDFLLHVSGYGRNAGEYWGPDGMQQLMTNTATYNGGVFD